MSDRVFITPPLHFSIAREYMKRGVRLDQVPELIQMGIQNVEQRGTFFASTSEMRKRHQESLRFTRQEGWRLLIDFYLQSERYAEAHKLLADIKASFLEPPDANGSSTPSSNQASERLFWEWSGRLAEKENRKLDAIVFYHRAQQLNKAQALWSAVGGTQDGWDALKELGRQPSKPAAASVSTTPSVSAIPWEKRGTPLPDFTLTDLQGKTWKLADLKGKVLFINLWATWCGPCIQELPHVQHLAEQLKDRSDVVVLTLNVDEQVGLVEPFVKKNRYTFSVIPAAGYVRKLLPELSIPRNWVVSPNGVLQMEQIGFGGSGETWLAEALKMIERAKTE